MEVGEEFGRNKEVMKAYKCPECGYLNEIFEPYGASLRKCPECGFSFVKNVVREKVDLIDWEQELLPDKQEITKN